MMKMKMKKQAKEGKVGKSERGGKGKSTVCLSADCCLSKRVRFFSAHLALHSLLTKTHTNTEEQRNVATRSTTTTTTAITSAQTKVQ